MLVNLSEGRGWCILILHEAGRQVGREEKIPLAAMELLPWLEKDSSI